MRVRPTRTVAALAAALLMATACASPEPTEEEPDTSVTEGEAAPADEEEPPAEEPADESAEDTDAQAADHEPCESVPITMGVLPPWLSNSALYIAEAKGYFAEQGVELETQQFRSGDDQTASLARGDLQVATGGPNAGLYNAVARGIGASIVATKGHGDAEHDWAQLVTTPELYEQGLQSSADLEGRSIGIVGRGATQEVGLSLLLESHGLTFDDVDETVLPFPEMPAALISGAVDVIFPLETTLTRMIQNDEAIAIASPVEAYPQQQHAVIFYSEQFIADNPEGGLCFMIAYLQGLRDYNDAFFHGEGTEEVHQILVDAGVVEDPALLEQVNLVGLNPDGYVLEESIATDIEFYLENGYLEEETTADALIDHSFVDQAIEVLGPYEQP